MKLRLKKITRGTEVRGNNVKLSPANFLTAVTDGKGGQ